jgi:phage protein D
MNIYKTPRPMVEMDGSELSRALAGRLEAVVVDQSLHKPSMFALTFADHGTDVISEANIRIGSAVKITADGWFSDDYLCLISGEVTSIEADYDHLATRTVVRGYDPSHRLHRGTRTETYRNVKASDIAATLASRLGCEVGTIDDTEVTHDYVAQVNQSDWDFLAARAREIAFELTVEDGHFNFRRPTEASEGPDAPDGGRPTSTRLVFGLDLITFHPRISAVGQPGDVRVRAWDPNAKNVILGSSDARAGHVDLTTKPAGLSGAFPNATHVIVDRPLGTQDEADRVAAAGAEQLGSCGFEAEGTVLGNPSLGAGVSVNISGLADMFNGRYRLTQCCHLFDRSGYYTQIGISGRRDRSLLGLTSTAAPSHRPSASGAAFPGVVIGQVTDNNDPDALGRLKVKLPWLSDDYESDWCRMSQLGAGPDSGAVWLPEVNDEVLLAFEFGDLRRPHIIGSLYNGQDKPRLGDGLFDSGKVKRRGFVSRAGHRLVFLDDANQLGIALISADGKCRVALDQTDGEVRVHCQGKVTIDTDQGDISLKSGGNLSVQAQGNLELKASDIKIESNASVAIKGSIIRLN